MGMTIETSDYVKRLENESFNIIQNTLKSFKQLFTVTTVSVSTQPIIPLSIDKKGFITQNYVEKPVPINQLMLMLHDWINKKQINTQPRLIHLDFQGLCNLWDLNNKGRRIQGWFGRTSKENQGTGRFPNSILEISYFLNYHNIHPIHEIWIHTYADPWYEISIDGIRNEEDLILAKENKRNLISSLDELKKCYPDSIISRRESEEKWINKDVLPFP
jgi:hypothetical protein